MEPLVTSWYNPMRKRGDWQAPFHFFCTRDFTSQFSVLEAIRFYKSLGGLVRCLQLLVLELNIRDSSINNLAGSGAGVQQRNGGRGAGHSRRAPQPVLLPDAPREGTRGALHASILCTVRAPAACRTGGLGGLFDGARAMRSKNMSTCTDSAFLNEINTCTVQYIRALVCAESGRGADAPAVRPARRDAAPVSLPDERSLDAGERAGVHLSRRLSPRRRRAARASRRTRAPQTSVKERSAQTLNLCSADKRPLFSDSRTLALDLLTSVETRYKQF